MHNVANREEKCEETEQECHTADHAHQLAANSEVSLCEQCVEGKCHSNSRGHTRRHDARVLVIERANMSECERLKQRESAEQNEV